MMGSEIGHESLLVCWGDQERLQGAVCSFQRKVEAALYQLLCSLELCQMDIFWSHPLPRVFFFLPSHGPAFLWVFLFYSSLAVQVSPGEVK
jgi:hypothetical protein